MKQPITSLKSLFTAYKSGLRGTFECDFTHGVQLDLEAETFYCYEASIVDGDIHITCDQGHITYVVDKYGDRHTFELFDWGLDSEEQGA